MGTPLELYQDHRAHKIKTHSPPYIHGMTLTFVHEPQDPY